MEIPRENPRDSQRVAKGDSRGAERKPRRIRGEISLSFYLDLRYIEIMDLKNIKPDIRYLKDMEKVVYDKEWLKKAPKDMELYYMYRGIDPPQILPRAKIEAGKGKSGLRYDITIIPPKMLGKEFVKTKGHNHPVEEKYIVLEGEAIFLVQKGKEKIEDVYAVKAKKGDEVIIPANYDDHIVINPSNQELKIGNWISEDCKNEYETIEKMKGACYFYIKGPSTKLGVDWVKNKNYKEIPKLRFEKI
jgi:glucose-6-phosphate isomerase